MSEYFVKVLQRMLMCTNSQKDVKNFIYMHSKWLEDATELQLFLTSSNTCYKATLKHDEIKTACSELEQPSYDDFFAECKQALTTHMGLEGFDYELDEKLLQFKLWKCKGFETMYVEVTVSKVSQAHQLLDAAIEWGQLQQASNPTNTPSTSDDDKDNLPTKKDYKLLVSEYHKYVEASKNQEHLLLTRFLPMLNGKKAEITKLRKQLEELKKPPAPDLDSDTETDIDKDSDDENLQSRARKSDDKNEGDDDDFAAPTQALTENEPMQE